MSTRQDYLDACQRADTEPVEFESQCLSCGFVPADVERARDADEPSAVYWAWLIAQLQGAEP